MKAIQAVLIALCILGCSFLEDAATSLAHDIERGVRQLESGEGSTHVIVHDASKRATADARTIKVQLDEVGALIVWYMDADGEVLESGSTTYLSRFVDIPETILVDKQIESPLSIEVQRRNGRAVVARAY